MLDHLTGGRLELGIGRGITAIEHTFWGQRPEEAQPRYEEALQILLQGLRGDTLRSASARARLESDGRLIVELAMTDIGTGSYTILTQIAAEAMGLPVERVTVRLGDTRFPPTDGSGGSYGAATSGAAVLAACRKLRDGLALGITEAEETVTPAELDKAYSHAGFGAHFAEVGVDRDTGEVRVRRFEPVRGQVEAERERLEHLVRERNALFDVALREGLARTWPHRDDSRMPVGC